MSSISTRSTAPGTPETATETDRSVLPDIQNSGDSRRVDIDKVGVKNVTFPLRLRTPDGGQQTTVAQINMYVALPHHQKGTHMSRFLEVLNAYSHPLTPDDIIPVGKAIRERLDAEVAHVEMAFPYFIEKAAPVTGARGLMDYQVRYTVETNSHDDFVLTVRAPATSLCPCSKEISNYGAHNQRCEIEASVRTDGSSTLWIEDLVHHLEAAASTQVYAVLKRPDERFVTEAAYDNPKFVEDIVRDLALRLDDDPRIVWYCIDSENYESIHNHNAYAQITRDKRNS
jgi:GTP cyclohydrolase I